LLGFPAHFQDLAQAGQVFCEAGHIRRLSFGRIMEPDGGIEVNGVLVFPMPVEKDKV
jgi:hypothetical protein